MKKKFVLDTNVLLHNSNCLFDFENNDLVLPIEVIDELDHFKREADERGRNARQIIRTLDELRTKGKLGDGVPLGNGGTLQVLVRDTAGEPIEGLNPDIMDNRILRAAYFLCRQGDKKDEKEDDCKVIFVSKDINARVKADAVGLAVMDYEKQKVNFDEIYNGWRSIPVTAETITEFYAREMFEVEGLQLYPNEFVVLEDESNAKHTALGKYLSEKGKVVPLFHQKSQPRGIRARNREQQFALELLLCDDIKLITLMGSAGTGKTLLALAAGIAKVVDERFYTKLLVSRPIIPFGRDIGFLPGDKEDKMRNWMQPIYDNLRLLVSSTSNGEDVEGKVDRLMQSRGGRTIEVEALTYIRGRSIPKQYMIVDEAQNLTPHEVKTIISRAGEDTKIILTGDPYQIDSPYLDASSNGLSYVVERMKGQKLFGHVTLTKSERSDLASLAASIL
jgi:PhoH-like ATPase